MVNYIICILNDKLNMLYPLWVAVRQNHRNLNNALNKKPADDVVNNV